MNSHIFWTQFNQLPPPVQNWTGDSWNDSRYTHSDSAQPYPQHYNTLAVHMAPAVPYGYVGNRTWVIDHTNKPTDSNTNFSFHKTLCSQCDDPESEQSAYAIYILHFWFRTTVTKYSVNPSLSIDSTQFETNLIPLFIHIHHTMFPAPPSPVRQRIPRVVLEDHCSKARRELLFVMCDTYGWIDRRPANFVDAVKTLQDVARMGPVERRLPCYDVLGLKAFYDAIAPLTPEAPPASFKKRIDQRNHLIFAPAASCIIRAVAATIEVPDPVLRGFVLRNELSKLFGLTVTTEHARNQSSLIRKRTFLNVSMFRGVLSRVVGLPEIEKIRDRDAVEAIFRRENARDLADISSRLLPLAPPPQPQEVVLKAAEGEAASCEVDFEFEYDDHRKSSPEQSNYGSIDCNIPVVPHFGVNTAPVHFGIYEWQNNWNASAPITCASTNVEPMGDGDWDMEDVGVQYHSNNWTDNQAWYGQNAHVETWSMFLN